MKRSKFGVHHWSEATLASPAEMAPTAPTMTEAEPVRLQKYLADAGVCSRRAAEALIVTGEVFVNGTKAELGQKITPGEDKITVEGRSIRARAQPRVTLAVHKPRGLVCSNEDPHNPETIFSLLPPDFATLRFFCAGRLDKDSEGLVMRGVARPHGQPAGFHDQDPPQGIRHRLLIRPLPLPGRRGRCHE